MSRLIFILGNSGTGKTSSMRNLTKEEASYITVTGKEFPFRSDIKPVKVKTMGEAKKMVEASKKPIVIIDDINYLFTREVFSADSKKNPFEIYDSLSKDFYHLVEAILNKDTEQNFYLMGHLENPDSEVRALKTLGQSTRKNNNPEGWTNLVFESVVDLDEFVFKVKTDGSGVKSPIDMFENSTVENDIKVINDKINKYYKGDK